MDEHRVSRRQFLRLAGASGAAMALSQRPASWEMPAAGILPPPSAPARVRRLYRNVAIADGRSARRLTDMSVLVADGRIAWIRPSDAEEDPGPATGLSITDARGSTIVPGLVDAHAHVTILGGIHYVSQLSHHPDALLDYAERNGEASMRAGVRWLRDVGSPVVVDPADGRRRGLALGVRDRWRGRSDRPTVRSAGGWLAPPGLIPRAADVANGTALPTAALRQLADGADFVKLYVQRTGAAGGSPWTAALIRSAVEAVHARGRRVTAHVRDLAGARTAVAGGVDCLEHGYRLDATLARQMHDRGTYLVTTLTVPKNWLRLGDRYPGTWYGSAAGRRYATGLLRDAQASARAAHAAGVKIGRGHGLGGGSVAAGQLAWEVESLVEIGMEPWQALGAATWRGGELLGEPAAGVIREGSPATFVLVRGDPLSEPGTLRRVVR
ncbi:MAG: amidohydrolase family protein [Chloroflexi bacterium]|nr:amidohydrolase family protein [Chloroflexota bacterium]